MANTIRILPEQMANLISAGEVIERPAAVVKELLENSIDASAKKIVIKIERGGRQLISIRDDGAGMSSDDALLCLERHATSKIAKPDDLDDINTLGFRGEAMPSIAAVSKMKITTRQRDKLMGTIVAIEGGKVKQVKEAGAPPGTKIEVANLFYNVPARRKFLKSEENELFHISSQIERLVIAHPHISFDFYHNERQLKFYPLVDDLKARILSALDANAEEHLLAVNYVDEYCKISGYVSTPDFVKNSRQYQLIYLNNRWIRNKAVDFTIYKAYGSFVEKGKFPLVVMFIEISPKEVDVNVHPTKREVRFRRESEMKKRLTLALNAALAKKEVVPQLELGSDPQIDSPEPEIVTQLKVDYHTQHYKYKTYKINQDAKTFEIVSLKDKKAHKAYRILGQVASLYLIVEYEDGFYIIDQHAAHERVLFEKVMDAYRNGPLESQHLMFPAQLELSVSKIELLKTHKQVITDFGFEIENMGPQSYFVKAVPAFLKDLKEDKRQLIYDILDELAGFGEASVPEKAISRIAASVACHSAIRDAEEAAPPVVESIVNSLFLCENPYVCPHGRPTIIRLSKDELARKFKRK